MDDNEGMGDNVVKYNVYIYMYIHHSCVMYVLCRIVVLSYPGRHFFVLS